jgi:excisionase family DNA binding protein
MEKLLTPEQVAKKLQVEPSTVKRWLREGKLQGIKPGKLWRIEPEALNEYLYRQTSAKLYKDKCLYHFYDYISALKPDEPEYVEECFHKFQEFIASIEQQEESESKDKSKVSFKNVKNVDKALKSKASEAKNAG